MTSMARTERIDTLSVDAASSHSTGVPLTADVAQGAELDAKLDTGATTSSIHAIILSEPDREDFDDEDADRNIVFKLVNEDDEERTVETEIVRWAAIKTKKGGAIYRPVVELELCLGGRLIKDEVTLADRAHFNYETLIGRNMLEKAGIIVDSSEIYTKKARCDD